MKIWVDADAAPVAVKDVVINAAVKRKIEAVFVANKQLSFPVTALISFRLVPATPDAADQLIADEAETTDLVITQDIPLAHILVTKGVTTISPRGLLFCPDNIGERLSVRDLMQELRDSGEITGGPKQFGDKEKRAFASTFDRELTRLLRLKQP